MSVVEARYAQALLSLTSDKDSAAAIESTLQDVVDTFAKNDEFRGFLCNPLVSPKAKQKMITSVFPDLSDKPLNFLKLLVDKSRIDLLPGIFKEYVEMRDEREGIALIQVYSPLKLDDSKVDQICKLYAKKLNISDYRVITKIDPALLGGVKVVVGDKVFDGSVRVRLTALKGAISEKLATANID